MDNKKRVGPKRILIDVNEDTHAEAKALAALKNTSLRRYVLQALLIQMSKDKRYL